MFSFLYVPLAGADQEPLVRRPNLQPLSRPAWAGLCFPCWFPFTYRGASFCFPLRRAQACDPETTSRVWSRGSQPAFERSPRQRVGSPRRIDITEVGTRPAVLTLRPAYCSRARPLPVPRVCALKEETGSDTRKENRAHFLLLSSCAETLGEPPAASLGVGPLGPLLCRSRLSLPGAKSGSGHVPRPHGTGLAVQAERGSCGFGRGGLAARSPHLCGLAAGSLETRPLPNTDRCPVAATWLRASQPGLRSDLRAGLVRSSPPPAGRSQRTFEAPASHRLWTPTSPQSAETPPRTAADHRLLCVF